MNETAQVNEETASEKTLHLMSKELEEAAVQFLARIEQLEKLLVLIEE